MKICKIWDSEYPWDVRVEKICESLIGSGHEVHLVCRNQNRRPEREDIGGIHIHRLPKFTGGRMAMLGFPFFFNPVWLTKIAKVIADNGIEIILVRDLPMALAGVLIGKARCIPCTLDMAEPYPEMLEGYRQLQNSSTRRRLANSIVRNSQFARTVERVACRHLNHIFPVSPEMKDNLISRGVDPSKITVVHNTPRLSELEGAKSDGNGAVPSQGRDDPVKVVYVGDLTEARGLPMAVHAIQRLVEAGEQFRLVIIGKGRYEQEVRAIVREKGVEAFVEFLGFIPHEVLPAYVAKCDIGIIPHVDTRHNNLTLPNKVFDYMGLGLPVVSADLKPITRVIEENDCGITFQNDDVSSLVCALLKLKDSGIRQRLGQNGHEAVVQRYNWSTDYDALVFRLQYLCGDLANGK